MLEIYDENGTPITWEQLIATMGAIELHPRPDPTAPGWALSCIQIHADPAADSTPSPHVPNAMAVNLTRDGRPVIGKKIAWYWPDAPVDPAAGWLGRADQADTRTNDSGTVDLCMGRGAYYSPPGGGPHAVWIYGNDENSEMIQGLGMLAGTSHTHLDVSFAWTDPTTPDDLLTIARDIRDACQKILAALEILNQ